jgi:hypothetical protein
LKHPDRGRRVGPGGGAVTGVADKPMSTIAGVNMDVLPQVMPDREHRRIEIVLACSCRRWLAIPVKAPLPKIGEPEWCWGQHENP